MIEPLRIVVGVDFSEASQMALGEAFLEAQRRLRQGQASEVHVVVVVEDHVSGLPLKRSAAALEEIINSVRSDLEQLIISVRRRTRELHPELPEVTTVANVRVGATADEIVGLAAEKTADLIVVGTHGRRGVARAVLGSVAEKVVRMAPCPVLVSRPLDWRAFIAVPRPEPADAAATGEAGEAGTHREPHRYGYSSVVEPKSPLNHML